MEKIIYSFGDSIVKGHVYARGFVDEVADRLGVSHQTFAKNGAAFFECPVMGGKIIEQVKTAPRLAPDLIIFDGGTNDAEYLESHPDIKIGEIPAVKGATSTIASAMEQVIQAMQAKWPNVPILYVAVHKLAARDFKIQEALHQMELQAVRKYDVFLTNLYDDSELDTRKQVMRQNYSFDKLDELGMPGKNGSGTHPNWLAVEKYYLPAVLRTIKKGNKDGIIF